MDTIASRASKPDPWDESISNTKKKTDHIPDDWEDDDLEEIASPQLEETSTNRSLWNEANSNGSLHSVAVAPSSASRNIIASAASAALSAQPARIILKRPVQSLPNSSTSSSETAQQKSLAERQSSYQAARAKIFGSSSPDSLSTAPSLPSSVSSDTVSVRIRDPHGPTTGPDGKPTRGFSKMPRVPRHGELPEPGGPALS